MLLYYINYGRRINAVVAWRTRYLPYDTNYFLQSCIRRPPTLLLDQLNKLSAVPLNRRQKILYYPRSGDLLHRVYKMDVTSGNNSENVVSK